MLNNLNFKKEYSLEEIRYLTCCAFAFMLPFDRVYTQIILILLLIFLLIDYKSLKISKINKNIWKFQLVFILSVIGSVISNSYNNTSGFIIEKQLAILLFPIIFQFSFDITKKRIEYIMKTFVISTTISLIYLLIANYINFINIDLPLKEYLAAEIGFNHSFSSFLNIHAGYFSMYVVFSFIFLIKKYKELKIIIIIPLLFLYSIALLFLASRANIFSLLFIIILIYPLFNIKNKFKSLMSIFIGVTLFTSFMLSSPYLTERFGISVLEDLGLNKEEQNEPRMSRWIESIKIIKEAPIIGHGTGSELPKLKEKYKEENLIYSYFKEYNAHNQYLSITIKHGIIGLIIFCAALFYYFKIAVRSKDLMYITFLIIIIFNFFIENVLDANKGIFFFAFFNTLLGYYNLNIKDESTNISHNPII